jgi:hypothetical protein
VKRSPGPAPREAVDWTSVARDLEARGFARLPGLLSPAACGEVAALYARDEPFRKTIDMAPKRFGVGQYRYFKAPLPPRIEALRSGAYAPLAAIANDWRATLGSHDRFPSTHTAYLRRCHRQGQTKPTPLLLRYGAGGCNRLHQDVYGPLVFPLQLTVQLRRPGIDFEGGEFLLVEQHPREQSIGTALALAQGEAVIFPVRDRPAPGKRGFRRVQVRHGVSLVSAGDRLTLGIIFHDAA